MFAHPRPKKLLAPPSKKRKRQQHAIEEIKFDDAARAEYLTGFHKRKLQRTKQAQEQAAERARQEKIEARKQLREDRQREVDEHVQNVNNALKQAAQAGYIDDEKEESEDDTAAEWGGFQDAPAQPDLIDHEEEYIDEDRYTTVTVESVNVSKDGLTSSRPDEEESAGEEQDVNRNDQAQSEKTSDKNRHATQKKKKLKFRYENKLERQITNIKQKARHKRKSGRE
ncbi:nucleolar protein 12-domain-containing protein [Xylaria sp. CBS 124048]|nr:nucleolar protein 12-domain-containing protein [Xylaria sp. CBS 124048]